MSAVVLRHPRQRPSPAIVEAEARTRLSAQFELVAESIGRLQSIAAAQPFAVEASIYSRLSLMAGQLETMAAMVEFPAGADHA